MMNEIIKELTTLQKTNEVTSNQVLCSARRAEVQRAQKAILDVTKEREGKV